MRSRLVLLPLLAALGACNMVISEKPMFGEVDQSTLVPKDGIWLAESKDCRFDADKPESDWPKCAVWVIARNSGRELHASDGKGQTDHMAVIFASGNPAIVQGQSVDTAKKPPRITYGFYGIEPRNVGQDGRFALAYVWPVECGIRSGSAIKPFPGISAECRPSSKDAIRAAAISSWGAERIEAWRWLRPENR